METDVTTPLDIAARSLHEARGDCAGDAAPAGTCGPCRQEAETMIRALSESGYVVLPQEPTPRMLAEAAAELWEFVPGQTVRSMYQVMVRTYLRNGG